MLEVFVARKIKWDNNIKFPLEICIETRSNWCNGWLVFWIHYPLSVTKNPLFFNACKKSTNCGKGYVPPISETISTTLLKRSKEKVTSRHTCCTILTNGWLDMCHRMQINVLVCYHKELLFYKVIDTTDHKKSSVFIFKILESHSWN